MVLPRNQFQLHNKLRLTKGELASIGYHNLFGFPLTKEELSKWKVGELINSNCRRKSVKRKNGYYFVEEGDLLKRFARKECSKRKMQIAKRATGVLGKIATIRMVGVTGSLAMENANEDADIDLMVITAGKTMWVTRIIAYFTLKLFGFNLRKPKDRNEKDKLCLNMWMDERDLKIDRQNIYTSHEICQIVPLINEEKTYERFISENAWVREFWPNAVKIKKVKLKPRKGYLFFELVEPWVRALQFAYMSGRITKETVTATRAFFHPHDWSDEIAAKF